MEFETIGNEGNMKVAIIEDDKQYLDSLKEIIKGFSWEVDFFDNSEKFGESGLIKYSVIIADQDLPTINGRDLLKTISKKTTAELFLICSDFKKEDVLNDNIVGLIDKNNLENAIDQLKYVDSKLRIKKIMEEENNKFVELISNANGYTFKEIDEICLIEIKEILSERSRSDIKKRLNAISNCKCIITFLTTKDFSSVYLSLLTFFYKIIAGIKGEMVFLCENEKIIEYAKLCNLHLLFKMFVTLDEAIDHLKSS